MYASSKSDLGKPVLICILACSLAFHSITSERGTFNENRHFKGTTGYVACEATGDDTPTSTCDILAPAAASERGGAVSKVSD